MLSLINIKKVFGNEVVLNNLSGNFQQGLNFIYGPSGSGKTTLLNIISGMDQNFQGEVYFNHQSIKNFTEKELSNYYYNSIGFIWQDYRLIEYLSVECNIDLVLSLSNLNKVERKMKVTKVLDELGISGLAKMKVAKLSGGQKQRVAIARALVKDPEIIIADEPTKALDPLAAKKIMTELKKIAKERVVIIVTHDKGLIGENSNVYRIEQGQLKLEEQSKQSSKNAKKKNTLVKPPHLSLKNCIYQSFNILKGAAIYSILTIILLILSSFFMLINLSGEIEEKQDNNFNRLVEERGETIKDISIAKESTGGGSSGSLKQDTSGVVDLLKDDPRVEFMTAQEIVGNLKISIGDVVKNYEVQDSFNLPAITKLIAGRYPSIGKTEVAVPKRLLDLLDLKPSDVIGENLNMTGLIDVNPKIGSNEITGSKVSLDDVKVVGVIENNPKGGAITSTLGRRDGKLTDGPLLFSVEAIKKMRQQTGVEKSMSYNIRAKTLEDVLPIVNTLQESGLQSAGDFSMIEDMLQLRKKNEEQGATISLIFFILSLTISIVLALFNFYIKKSEFVFFKFNGFSNKNILSLTISEYFILGIMSSILFLLSFPLLSLLSQKIFNIYIVSTNNLVLALLLPFVQSILISVLSYLLFLRISSANKMKQGDSNDSFK
ncbi:ATP-binding cassette domain-containing protein [Enterococcus faecalis]|uniref:ATP-binding cassette domain-containing protein n=1 Tax=Enterococcus faecalis TaxID=1351 RepID=UPI0019296544|nr:ATP-binding cassette domain-containing protein [Enterococcus faecalis]EGO7759769.1 ATP-binding cassette domain-containing protein [Enterococcus faecalis]EGO8073376.1 ATP-binding cassette domain-containing protein [Enterococcus faecalis]EHM3170664.1 ATP-binding cassette domain-containing protein [Enterococcus faecalis]EHV2930265.1 ATP-binding cassette domain-containing protein [Enterococcus faecalis]EJM6101954.1 ATP-binding cassette domain-containing protein [Enterococcus faecalis]